MDIIDKISKITKKFKKEQNSANLIIRTNFYMAKNKINLIL